MDNKTRKLTAIITNALRATQTDKQPRTVYNPRGGDNPFFAVTENPAEDADNDTFFCWIEFWQAADLVEEAEEYSDQKSFADLAYDIAIDPTKYRRYPPAVDTLRLHLRRAGSVKSEAKAAAARENGKLGGRPRAH